jgi:hypothetical protein
MTHDCQLSAQLDLFTIRAVEIFHRVLAGEILMVDAADLLYDASISSGLDASVGTNTVQKVMAAAFASASAERDKQTKAAS